MSNSAVSFVFYSAQPHRGALSSGAIGPAGSIYATASADCDLKVFRLGVEAPIFSYEDLGRPLTVMEISRDESFLAAGTESGSAKVWDLRTGQMVWQEAVHKSAVTALCFDDEAEALATGSIDGTVRVWDFRGSHKVHELNTAVVLPVQDPAGVSSPAGAGRARPKQVQTTQVRDPTVTALAFTPNGHWLLVGNVTGRVLVWSLRREAVLHELLVSPQAGLSGSQDAVVDRGMYSETKETIRHICVHPRERTGIVTDASCVSFWDLDTFELLARGPIRAGGYYSTHIVEADNVAVSAREEGVSNFSLDDSASLDHAPEPQTDQTITSAMPTARPGGPGPQAGKEAEPCVYLTGAASGWASADLSGFLGACLRATRSVPQLVSLCASRDAPGHIRLTIVTLKYTQPFARRYGQAVPRRALSVEHRASRPEGEAPPAQGGREARGGSVSQAGSVAQAGNAAQAGSAPQAGNAPSSASLDPWSAVPLAPGAPAAPTPPAVPHTPPPRTPSGRAARRPPSQPRAGPQGPGRPAAPPRSPSTPAGRAPPGPGSCAPDPATFDPSRVDPRLLADPLKRKLCLGSEEWADLLSTRLAAARQFSRLWAAGSFRQAVEALLVPNDMRLLCDVMLKVDLRSGAGMDDLCPLVGPLTDCVLEETARPESILKLQPCTEQLICDGAKIVLFLGELFYRTIADTFAAFGRAAGAPDLALEDRHARCMGMYRAVCAYRRAMIDFEPRVITSKMKGLAIDAISKLGSMGFRDDRK